MSTNIPIPTGDNAINFVIKNIMMQKVKLLTLITIMIFACHYDVTAKEVNENIVSEIGQKDAFSLTDCPIIYDPSDYKVVETTVSLFASDVEAVTGRRPQTSRTLMKGQIIIIGTLGRNKWIDRLATSHKLDIAQIKGAWERFAIRRVNHPMPGVDRALVIVGSDRRGTAYGAFTLSQQMGVSPWAWWADVPVAKHHRLYVNADYTSPSPSVKYRGIFINDEDWGLKPWASGNYEKDLRDIGPKTYARVCELILRLKGNMLAPAMHSCTGAFYTHPESKVVADRYGIIITTSHCEPMLLNNACKKEWDSQIDGEWNYVTNRSTILKKFEDRIRETSPYENIYTVAMRGLHDAAMRGNLSLPDRVKVLTQVIEEQRILLSKYITKKVDEIPQIFVPYKETMEVYESGLKVPQDVTLVWPDDNYGYMKRLSNSEEQQRKGGSGVYYHISYLGAPHDYLWICTTPPTLMYEELRKAFDTGANRYWLLNVGDIKPGELCIQTFFDMAWNINRFDYSNINDVQPQFLSNIYGPVCSATYGSTCQRKFKQLLDTYYRLAWSRKPEFMGWEREWDAKEFRELSDTKFSFQNYNDAQKRLYDYQMLAAATDSILSALPENYRPSFFQLFGYSALGACQMNRKFLMAQLNHEKTKSGDVSQANWAAKESQAAYDSITALTMRYNTMLDGKWNGMMKPAPGLNAKYQNMPQTVYVDGRGESPVSLTPVEAEYKLDGCTVLDLSNYSKKVSSSGHLLRVIEGIGYDWVSIRLGEPTEKKSNPQNLNGDRFEYEFNCDAADSVRIHVYTVPFFPLYKGCDNQFGVSIDGAAPQVMDNKFSEFSRTWKNQVLQNGAEVTAVFPITKARKHTISFICGSPGVMIERVVIDWGGMKCSYVGPSFRNPCN
jgi:hypothetical protein